MGVNVLVDPNGLVTAAKVQPDDGGRFVVAWCDDHKTLNRGDVVTMTEVSYRNVFVREADLTVHSLMGDWGYVILSPIQ